MTLHEVPGQDVTSESQDRLRKGLLMGLVEEQREENTRSGLSGLKLDTKDEIVSWYKGNEMFERLKSEIVQEFSPNKTEEEIASLRHRVAGRIFEDMAYVFLSKKMEGLRDLLSPERASRFWSEGLYPESEGYSRTKNPFTENSIKGIYVPDGLSVAGFESGDLEIAEVTEYKAGLKDDKGIYSALTGFDIASNTWGNLFRFPRLVLVSLKSALKPFLLNDKPDVLLVRLPFDNVEFREIVDDIALHHLPEILGSQSHNLSK